MTAVSSNKAQVAVDFYPSSIPYSRSKNADSPIWQTDRFTEAYMPSLLDMRKLAYEDTEFVQPEYVCWQLNDNPSGRAVSWIATDAKNEVLGEYWIVPQRVRIHEKLYLGSIGANALVHPSYRRLKIFSDLGSKCSGECEKRSVRFTVYMPNRFSIGGLLEKLDCIDLGAIPLLIYPLNIERIAAYWTRNQLSARILSFFMRKGYQLIARKQKGKQRSEPIEVSPIETFDQSYDSFWSRVKDKYSCMTARDRSYMNWRYRNFPFRKYSIFIAKRGDCILGYLVARRIHINKLSAGCIVDVLIESSEYGWLAGMSLMDAARRHFEREEASLICCLALPHTEEYALIKARGFVKCPEILKPHPLHMVVQAHHESSDHRAAFVLGNWYWTFGDYDVF